LMSDLGVVSESRTSMVAQEKRAVGEGRKSLRRCCEAAA
jgi:hypothetical protein